VGKVHTIADHVYDVITGCDLVQPEVHSEGEKKSGEGREGGASGKDISVLEKHRMSPAIARNYIPCTCLSATCPSIKLISYCDRF
jgi:hypothetical protein